MLGIVNFTIPRITGLLVLPYQVIYLPAKLALQTGIFGSIYHNFPRLALLVEVQGKTGVTTEHDLVGRNSHTIDIMSSVRELHVRDKTNPVRGVVFDQSFKGWGQVTVKPFSLAVSLGMVGSCPSLLYPQTVTQPFKQLTLELGTLIGKYTAWNAVHADPMLPD